MRPEIVLRVVAAAAAHFLQLRAAGETSLTRAPIALRLLVVPTSLSVSQCASARRRQREQIGGGVDVVHDDVDVAIVVEIGECRAAAGGRGRHRRTEPLRDVLEASVAEVAVHDLALLVARLRLDPLDLRIDVAIDDEEVEPAVVVEIDEADAPSEPAGVQPDAGGERPIVAEALAAVGVQRRGVAGEVGLEEIDGAIAVVVADRDAHPGLRLAVLAVGAAGLDGDVLERAVAVD